MFDSGTQIYVSSKAYSPMLGAFFVSLLVNPCSVFLLKQWFTGYMRDYRYSKMLGRAILVDTVTASLIKFEECMNP